MDWDQIVKLVKTLEVNEETLKSVVVPVRVVLARTVVDD